MATLPTSPPVACCTDAVDLAAAVEQGDIDELVRLVDGLCATREWEALSELRERCQRAFERGRQLWPVATHAEYRLALEAPGPFAASVLVEGTGRFALGPLPEVAASTHTWAELEPHLTSGPSAVLTAHERVVRGEDLTGIELPGPPVLELPLRLQSWEPQYSLAEYRHDKADFPAPAAPHFEAADLPTMSPPARRDGDAVRALLDLARAWTSGSEGRADAIAVEGTALDAIAALGLEQARIAELTPAAALATMAWTAASGGAHGRRPGAAAGRFGAWWAAAALTDSLEPWPADADALGDAVGRLRWFLFDSHEPETGWSLHLAAGDTQHGRAWAVAAVDSA